MRRAWLVGGVVAAGLIGAYLALFMTPRPTPPLPVEVPARRAAPKASLTPALSPPSIASVPAAAMAAAAPTQPRRIDLTCREEDIPQSQTEEHDPKDQRAAVLAGQQLLKEIRYSLTAAGDAPSRALALYVAAMDHSIDPKGCEGNDCTVPVEAQSQTSARAASELALLAQATKLPLALALALHACKSKASDPVLYPACGNVSAQHWADAAPSNAWAWLLLATEAQVRKDPSGVESAMHRAALAGDWQHPGDEARRMLVSHLPSSVTSIAVMTALLSVGSLHAEKAGLGTLAQYCGANQDANRAQTCARLAAGLFKSANDLFQLSLAIKVGARSGMPPDLLAAAEAQRDSAQANMKSTIDLWTDPRRACPFFQVQARVAIRSADIGELAAIQEEFRARSQK